MPSRRRVWLPVFFKVLNCRRYISSQPVSSYCDITLENPNGGVRAAPWKQVHAGTNTHATKEELLGSGAFYGLARAVSRQERRT
jgi:hypothetical protein